MDWVIQPYVLSYSANACNHMHVRHMLILVLDVRSDGIACWIGRHCSPSNLQKGTTTSSKCLCAFLNLRAWLSHSTGVDAEPEERILGNSQ